MKATVDWTEGLPFTAKIRGHEITLDSPDPGGRDRGPSPKETLIASILGCTGIDVVSSARKNRIDLKEFRLSGNAESRPNYPKVFDQIDVVFDLKADLADSDRETKLLLESVELSMTKYCSVSAMVSPTSPIFYTVRVNGEIEGRGEARFPTVNPSASET